MTKGGKIGRPRKFTPTSIRVIRDTKVYYSCAQIAKQYGVSASTIWYIVHRKTYGDIDPIFCEKEE